MNFRYLDTGAMYRAVAVAAQNRGIDLDDGNALREFSKSRSVSFSYDPGSVLPSHVYFGDEDLTDQIRTPQADAAVSKVASCADLREDMLKKQRALGAQGNFVVEGRDIGSVVFPNAALKIYLTADVKERARRRAAQNKARGMDGDFDTVLAALKARDERDMNRKVAPLVIADGATILDTTDMDKEQSIQAIVDLATITQDQVCGEDKGVGDDNLAGIAD
jgi:cytidylate kinase